MYMCIYIYIYIYIYTKRIHSIRQQDFHFTSKNVVYLFTCKTCHKQCTGSTKVFWSRFSNCRCAHRNFLRYKHVI